MGGNAFPHHPTPRLQPSIYSAVLARCLELVEQSGLFDQVECPAEAPGKLDHGDVDLLVVKRPLALGGEGQVGRVPDAVVQIVKGQTYQMNGGASKVMGNEAIDGEVKGSSDTAVNGTTNGAFEHAVPVHENNTLPASEDALSKPPVWTPAEVAHLTSIFHAAAYVKNGVTLSLCIPLSFLLPACAAHATQSADPAPTTPSPPDEQQTQESEPFAQLDLHLSTPSLLAWELFTGSYGDLLQILGCLQRPLGLTATDQGLFVRVREVEDAGDRKGSFLFLTRDVREAVRFLGLDDKVYCISPIAADGEGEGEGGGGRGGITGTGFRGREDVYGWLCGGRFFWRDVFARVGRGRLSGGGQTANDRKRLKGRHMFRVWMEEWMPEHIEEYSEGKREWTRDEVLSEALEFFGKTGVTARYDRMMEKLRLKQRETRLLEEIRARVPETGDRLSQVVRGLKRYVRLADGEFFLASPEADSVELDVGGGLPAWMDILYEDEAVKEKLFLFLEKEYASMRTVERGRVERLRKKKDGERLVAQAEEI